MRVILGNFPYKYMEYEKELQIREIQALMPSSEIISTSKDAVEIEVDEKEVSFAYELTFSAYYQTDESILPTRQALLEKDDTLKATKQHTRYSTHGIHEYKGKFNPQVVHCLMNIFGVKEGSYVLDPFDGSGTTLLECAHANVKAYGTDINPMACFIANTKVKALSINVKEAKAALDTILSAVESPVDVIGSDKRIEYLMSWIPLETLRLLETIRHIANNYDSALRDLLLLVASDLIRDYSLQEPSDLRIRRRISPFPELPFMDAFSENLCKYLRKIEEVQLLKMPLCCENHAILCDIKKDNPFGNLLFDVAITSPPYVTALPYIDTQRISLVWLGLCEPADIGKLEAMLIGSREIIRVEKAKWLADLSANTYSLPSSIYEMIVDMNDSLCEQDGFRKKAVPALTYRYFAEMKDMFQNVHNLMKPGGKYALIVGHNRTTLGGKEFNIDTPMLLGDLAVSCGWKLEEIILLQTYKRYGLNSKNAINRESLIILER